jgi:hypothetical protein
MSNDDLLQAKVNLETAPIAWSELQRFFASGTAVYVAPELDLTRVATAMAQDNAAQIKHWMDANQVQPVSDPQAEQWCRDDATVWAVVVKPWVVVQERDR